jgi:hypothetical protein
MRPRFPFPIFVPLLASVLASVAPTAAIRADGFLFDPPPIARGPRENAPPQISRMETAAKIEPERIEPTEPAEKRLVKLNPPPADMEASEPVGSVPSESQSPALPAEVVASDGWQPIARDSGFSMVTDTQEEPAAADPAVSASPSPPRTLSAAGVPADGMATSRRPLQAAALPFDPGYASGAGPAAGGHGFPACNVACRPSACCQSAPAPVCGAHAACCSCQSCRSCVPWTMPQPWITQMMGIRFGGWVDQGVSTASNMPADRYNGPVTFNDRDGEYQVNQVWLYAERDVNNYGCGLEVGGRIDFVYGTDARFTQSVDGLEADWDQREPFYQVALPQFYVDLAYNDWTVRAGRFFTILGYETVAAPENFFYSHAYTMQYGEPFTHFGLLATRRLGRMELSGGFHRGNNQFDDTDGLDALNLLGGMSYTSCDERLSAGFAFSITEEGPNVTNYVQSLVATVKLTDRLTYVIQGDYGETWDEVNRSKDVWDGLNQYMFYTINDCWAAGIRTEWFRDRDGSRVSGRGLGNRNTGPYAGDFYEITLGLNWSPHANLTVRPEARWDIFDPIGTPGNLGAYDAGDRNTQFLFGCDVICTF